MENNHGNAQENLQNLTEIHRLALDAADIGTWDYDLPSNRFFGDKRCREIFGVPHVESLSFDQVREIIHPEDRDRVNRAMQEALSPLSDGRYSTEYRVFLTDGSMHWILARGQASFRLKDEARRPVRFTGLVMDITERKTAEERLVSSERRLHQFIGAMDEVVFEFDSEGRYLNVWSGNETLLKRPPQELLGRRVEEVVPQELAKNVKSALWQVRHSGQPETLEYPLDVLGGRRWFLARIAMVTPAQGEEPTFSFLARDITNMKKAERRLRESERRFRGLFENAATGIALVGLDGRCLETNQCLLEMLGYSKEELRQNTFATISHPDDVPGDLAQFDRLLRGEISSYRLEKRYIRKDGSQLWGHLTVTMQRDESGDPLYCISIVENITRRKTAEAEKEHLLGELDAIFTSAADGIIFYDKEGSIRRMNEAAKEILGYSDKQIRAKLVERYKHWEPKRPDGTLVPLEESVIFRALNGETIKNSIVQFRRPDGRQIWVSKSVSPVFDSSGCRTGAVITFTDITRIQELHSRLEDYLHMMAHDLRTPLTVISGHAEILAGILEQKGLAEESQVSKTAILNATEQMQQMMEDLVEVGRLESGQIPLYQDLIRLSDFIEEFLKRHVSEEYRRVGAKIPADLPPIRFGKHHLGRLLENLIGNALKYSAPCKPVEVRASSAEGQVYLAVKDYGQGIAEEDLPRLFERFFRTAAARKTSTGTGMGLYITKKILEVYGGSLQVESEVGKGSEFTIRIPSAAIQIASDNE